MIRTNPTPQSHPAHLVTRRLHAVLDYVCAVILLLASSFIPFHDPNMKTFSMAAGGFLLLYTILTDYKLSLLRMIPFFVHRGADLMVGVLVAFSPIHFGVRGFPAILFIVTGGLLIYLSFWTHPDSST